MLSSVLLQKKAIALPDSGSKVGGFVFQLNFLSLASCFSFCYFITVCQSDKRDEDWTHKRGDFEMAAVLCP